MGMKFRKSINLGGGARINLSKSGIGASVGTKGFRVTKKAGGGTRTTMSIPGTGISHVSDSSGHSSHSGGRDNSSGSYGGSETPHSGKQQSPVTKTELILVWLLGWLGAHRFYRKKFGTAVLYLFTFGVAFIGWWGDAIRLTAEYFAQRKGKTLRKPLKILVYIIAGLMSWSFATATGLIVEDPPDASEPSVPAIVETVPETTAPETDEPDATEPSVPVIVNTVPEATEPEVTVPETITPETTVPETVAPETTVPEPTEKMVWIDDTGHKYHSRSSCSNMSDPYQVSISEAERRGYTPCKRCH